MYKTAHCDCPHSRRQTTASPLKVGTQQYHQPVAQRWRKTSLGSVCVMRRHDHRIHVSNMCICMMRRIVSSAVSRARSTLHEQLLMRSMSVDSMQHCLWSVNPHVPIAGRSVNRRQQRVRKGRGSAKCAGRWHNRACTSSFWPFCITLQSQYPPTAEVINAEQPPHAVCSGIKVVERALRVSAAPIDLHDYDH